MLNFDFKKVLNFLPFELIKASDLKKGDIFFNYSWYVVFDLDNRDPTYNNGRSLLVNTSPSSSALFVPSESVKIIQRSIVDSNGLNSFLNEFLEENRKYQEAEEKKEAEEREIEIEFLKHRLSELE